MNEDIMEKYEKVGNVLDKALGDSRAIEMIGEEENRELAAIYNMLKELNDKFKIEIDKLEKSSEWEKFCVAFFGETNAGKSTVIETLRVIYDEEQRRIELNEQLDEYKKSLKIHSSEFENIVNVLSNFTLALEKSSKKRMCKSVIRGLGLFVSGIVVGVVLAFVL